MIDRGGDLVLEQFDGLPPSARMKMLVAEPPYRLCDAIMFYEYFILFGEGELLAMMERVDQRAKLPPLPRRKKIWISAMLLLAAAA